MANKGMTDIACHPHICHLFWRFNHPFGGGPTMGLQKARWLWGRYGNRMAPLQAIFDSSHSLDSDDAIHVLVPSSDEVAIFEDMLKILFTQPFNKVVAICLHFTFVSMLAHGGAWVDKWVGASWVAHAVGGTGLSIPLGLFP